jgi:prevent-host-death family protein
MNKVVEVTELRRRFKAIFDEVVNDGTPYIITRGSQPKAAFLPYDEFIRYRDFRERDILSRFDRLVDRMAKQNERFSDLEIDNNINEARTNN